MIAQLCAAVAQAWLEKPDAEVIAAIQPMPWHISRVPRMRRRNFFLVKEAENAHFFFHFQQFIL
jgi:hypothetical protein